MIDKMTAKLKHLPVDPGVYQFFNSKNENDLWDGTYENNVVPQGSYFYKIEFVGIDFEKYEKTGQINVLY